MGLGQTLKWKNIAAFFDLKPSLQVLSFSFMHVFIILKCSLNLMTIYIFLFYNIITRVKIFTTSRILKFFLKKMKNSKSVMKILFHHKHRKYIINII
jgi:hypothetical protein